MMTDQRTDQYAIQSASDMPASTHGVRSGASHARSLAINPGPLPALCPKRARTLVAIIHRLSPPGMRGAPIKRALALGAMIVSSIPAISPAAPPALDRLRMRSYPATTNGVFKARSGGRIGGAWVDGAYRAVETPRNQQIDGLTIADLKATNLRRDGIRLCLAQDVVIERFDLSHAAEPSTGRDLPEGIALGSNGCGQVARNVTIRDGRVSGFRWEGKGYKNGDGIATEGGTQGSITDVVASDNSDGGFDLKGRWSLDRLTAERNSRNYRFWGDVTAGSIVSRDGGTAVWLGRGAQVHIARLIASSSKPARVFVLDGATRLTVDACDLSGMAPGSELVKSDGSGNQVSLGDGCRL